MLQAYSIAKQSCYSMQSGFSPQQMLTNNIASLDICSFLLSSATHLRTSTSSAVNDYFSVANSICILQGALARGALFTSDVRLWLQLMSTPIVGSLCKLLPAFRSRMLGNPRFLMVLGIEEAIGVAAKWSAEKSSRGDKFWKVTSAFSKYLHAYQASHCCHAINRSVISSHAQAAHCHYCSVYGSMSVLSKGLAICCIPRCFGKCCSHLSTQNALKSHHLP